MSEVDVILQRQAFCLLCSQTKYFPTTWSSVFAHFCTIMRRMPLQNCIKRLFNAVGSHS